LEPVKGYLEIMDKGFGFLRTIENNFQPLTDNPFVPNNLINRLKLREGSYIEGFGAGNPAKNKNLRLARVESVNGIPFKTFEKIPFLHEQTSINPCKRFFLAQGKADMTGRALDMIVPIGMGQRGLISAPPKSGKTTILKHMAGSILKNHPKTALFVLLVDERPEEVTDFQRNLPGAHVLFSSSDQHIDQHMRMTRFAIHTAIRCAEAGQNTIVFIDSLTRMTRAFNSEINSHGKTLTGGLGANAMTIPRKIFGAARNLEFSGSLTIIATILIDTGSRMDDIIFQEFKGTGNMDLMLSRECAEHRIWPAININQSGTRKEDLLLDKDQYSKSIEIRRYLSSMDEVSAMQHLLTWLESN